jgi:cation:H+ antiporter
MWIWIIAIVAGLVLAMLASRRAVVHVSALAAGSRIPPFFFGITLVAIGTDLPEMANSIAAAVSGHGDINVGDSVGSVATQITLILGLLALIAGSFPVKKSQVVLIGGVTILSLVMGAVLLSDGHLSRSDSMVLILAWLMASVAMWRQGSLKVPSLEKPTRSKLFHGGAFFCYLTVVGLGATLAVTAFVKISVLLSMPEYLVSFFAASIGTSLPELFVDLTAFRQGHHQLAIGGIFGASLVDSSLSMAIGPLIVPTSVTAELALRGSAVAAIAVLAATLLLGLTGRLTRKTGVVLVLVYAAIYPLLLWGGLAPV